MTIKLFLSMFYAGCILAFIGACAPISPQDSVAPRITTNIQDTESNRSIVRQAEEMVLNSGSSDALIRDSLLLDAAILFAQGGDIEQSRQTLNLIVADNLSDSFFVEYSLLGLELDIARSQFIDAKRWSIDPRMVMLRETPGINFSRRILSLESDLSYASGAIETSIKQLIQLSELFADSNTLGQSSKKSTTHVIHNKLWRQLNELPFATLQNRKPGARDTLSGWYELAATLRYQQGDPLAQQSHFAIWQQRWSKHPGANNPPAALTDRVRGQSPKDIALLLPLQDEYKIPSDTLLSGFMSSYYQKLAKGSAVPNVTIYDTSTMPVTEVYSRAVSNGAQLIIGPMRQSQVDELLLLPELDVPTMTLNRIDKSLEQAPENLIQFGLSALDEVQQIADRAWRQGQTNVLLIAPDNGWGQRASEYFVQYWNAKGGVVIEAIVYPTAVNDFTKLLKSPLEIDLSERRGLELRRSINRSLSYTERRREDIDLVIVLGYSAKVRQIKPALDFLYAGDIPVYASSHIYNGTQQVELNRDLSGIQFSAMPWTLKGHIPRPLNLDQRLPTAYRQLFALGYDAFLLHAMLDKMDRPKAIPMFGSTGLLTLSNGVIKREGKWAVFQQGQVVPVNP